MKQVRWLTILGLLLLAGACAARRSPVVGAAAPAVASDDPQLMSLPTTTAAWADGAQLFDGLGEAHRVITTSSPEAQRYFDQGVRLMWAFNHDEATRSFARAAAIDPTCASCYWGVALTVGPNYNLPFLSAERAKVAFEALHLAQSNAFRASDVEKALIAALAVRYPNDRPLDANSTVTVLRSYAAAMHDVAMRFPADLDVQTLYAESLMNVNAWKLWSASGEPAPGTTEILATLSAVLKVDPNHPGANHYYIHAVEASPHPEQGLVSAGRVAGLAPAAGHLVHMPAHILQRVGRYEDAAEANRRAAVADEAYYHRTQAPDYYPVMYTAHNYQFLAYSTAMQGRRAETIAAVDRSRAAVTDSMLLAMPGADWYVAESYAARVRFGMWEEILSLPRPDPRLPGLTGGYLYARGVAQAATGHVRDAHATLNELREFMAKVPADSPAGQNTVRDVLAIATSVLDARIASAEQREEDAIALLRKAVTAEDRLAYDEPKNWFFPARHLLGAALLRAGAAGEAERAYREDLRENPANGWSLFGLGAALKAQHQSAQADTTMRDFRAAWQRADVTIASSAF